MLRHHPVPSDCERRVFDVIVIGGGINGLAVARDAAMRGLDVAVVEKGDIGQGTTSWSTRLIHGGLRYLEHAEIGLVRESLRERERLLRNAPHLVHPLPIALPIYHRAHRRPATIRLGMILYDLLSFDKSVPRHRMLSRAETIARYPGLRQEELLAAALYYDAQATFPERLAVEQAISACEHGATLLTYTRVECLCTDGAVVTGVEARDLLTGNSLTLRGRLVVNAAGPWVDDVLASAPHHPDKRLIGGTKGSHLVVAPFPGAPQDALYFEARADGRAIFVIPWNGNYLIGTTDIRTDQTPDEVQADDAEIAYLINETNALIPSAGLTRHAVLYTYCGVRPLPYQPKGSEGAITRRHIIHDHAPQLRGLISIIGGKLTTHRSLAEEVVDLVCARLGINASCPTARAPFPGSAGIAPEPFRKQLARETGLGERQVDRLVSLYGARSRDVVAHAKTDPDLLKPFDPRTGALGVEVIHALRCEWAETLPDVLMRRTMIGLAPGMAIGADEAAAAIAARHLGWDATRCATEVAAYRASLGRFRPRQDTCTPASA